MAGTQGRISIPLFSKGAQWTFSSASAPYPPDQVHYAVHGTAWWPLHYHRPFVSMPTDIRGKKRVLDQITARHHPQTAPTYSFLCTRASASMAGANDCVRGTIPFSTRPMDFFPCFGTYPSLPAVYRRMEEQCSSMHCHVTTRFDVRSCPAKGGHRPHCSSPPPQIHLQLRISPASERQSPWQVQKIVCEIPRVPVHAQRTFSPGFLPAPPSHLNFAAQATSR
jgi:hypothetical protein